MRHVASAFGVISEIRGQKSLPIVPNIYVEDFINVPTLRSIRSIGFI